MNEMTGAQRRSVCLSDVCTHRKDTIAPQRAVNLPYVGLEHIDSGKPYLTRSGSATEVRSSKNRFYPKDILYGKLRPYLEKAVSVSFEGICSTDILVLTPNELIDPDLLVNLLHSFAFGQHAIMTTHGVNHPRTSWKAISQFQFSLPPMGEQRAMARILTAMQNSQQALVRELALERERKASLMDYLFTHGTLGERSKKTEIGEIPESWELTFLGKLCEDDLGTIQTGPFGSQLHASDYVQTGIPVVNPTHLGFNRIERERLPHIREELADSLSKHYLFEGDILISRRGDFSRFAYINSGEEGWLCGTGCMLVRLANPAIDNYFLALSISLESLQNYLKHAAVGSIMPNLNTTILSQMPVLIPTIEEQYRISEILQACEAKVRALEREISLLHELLIVTLEELMIGRLSVMPLVEDYQR